MNFLRGSFILVGLMLVGCGEDVCVLGVGDCSELETVLQISASSTSVATGSSLTFTASGGTEPRIFSIIAANPTDFGSINATTGEYTPGSDTGVVCIRVTDSNSDSADLCITVTS